MGTLSKNCDGVGISAWIGSIVNHIWYFCVCCEGNPILLKENWVIVLYQIVNRHFWDTTNYQSCQHAQLMKRDLIETLWLVGSSPAHVALENIIKKNDLLNNLVYLPDFSHTRGIEVYHLLYNRYCPQKIGLLLAWNGCTKSISCFGFQFG